MVVWRYECWECGLGPFGCRCEGGFEYDRAAELYPEIEALPTAYHDGFNVSRGADAFFAFVSKPKAAPVGTKVLLELELEPAAEIQVGNSKHQITFPRAAVKARKPLAWGGSVPEAFVRTLQELP